MEQRNVRKLILLAVLPVVVRVGGERVFAEGPPAGGARALEVYSLLGSVEGAAEEPPRVFRTREGYLRFLMAPPGTHFAVEPGERGTAEETAEAFLEKWRNLFVNKSAAVGFDTIWVKSSDSRSYVRYQQKYAGLEVFGAQMIVQVNATGGVVAVMSDVMRDTEALDSSKVSLGPAIDAVTARGKAIELLAAQHNGFEFEATRAVLMVFCPPVVGDAGPTQLVWQTEVGNVGEEVVREFVLVNAHTGQVAFDYPLICGSLDRFVRDYGVRPLEDYDESDEWPTGIGDVDRAWDYMADFYKFYSDYHSRDSYDGTGGELKAHVHWYTTTWSSYWKAARFKSGWVSDDAVGHEFTHGVTWADDASGLLYEYESGAINESFSDMWGEWIDQTYNHNSDAYEYNDDNDAAGVKWLIGEDLIDGTLRDMADPPEYSTWYGGPMPDRYNSPYWYDGSTDEHGVHHNSGVGNKLAYLVDDGGSFNAYSISGIGLSDAADLFYECQVHLLTSSADYYDLGNVLQLAAINIGLTSSERYDVEKACRAVEIYTVSSRFYVKNSSGVPAAWFDDLGNLVLTGKLYESSSHQATSSDEFRVQDSSGNDVAIIDASNGNMYIDGDLYEEQGTLSPSAGSGDFIVKDSSGNVVAYIDDSGDLYLKGKLYEGD